MEFYSDEEWIELRQDPAYLVSTRGRLYDSKKKMLVELRLQKQPKDESVWVWYIRTSRSVRAATTVLNSFVGSGQTVMYIDNDKKNVSLDNLSWKRDMVSAK